MTKHLSLKLNVQTIINSEHMKLIIYFHNAYYIQHVHALPTLYVSNLTELSI